MGKVFHKLYTIQVKGDSSKEAAIDDMILSVVQALQYSYPRVKLEGNVHTITGSKSLTLMVSLWPVRKSPVKKDLEKLGDIRIAK